MTVGWIPDYPVQDQGYKKEKKKDSGGGGGACVCWGGAGRVLC